MFRFLADTQLPPKLSKYLSENGFDSRHTIDFPEGRLLKDADIIRIARDENRIIVTKDRDFFDNYLLKGCPPKVIQLQFGNINNKHLLDLIRVNWGTIKSLLEGGAEMILFSPEQIVEYGSK